MLRPKINKLFVSCNDPKKVKEIFGLIFFERCFSCMFYVDLELETLKTLFGRDFFE